MPGPFRGRIAYASYVDESLFGNPHATAVQRARLSAPELSDAAVLSASELHNISFRARSTGREMSQKQLDRERLHALSNARKAKWPNTIEANRERKERVRQEKLDAEERMRQEIDKEEEALQAEKRRLAIERANKMLYDSTDRVKALHSKLMLSDVLHERERQLELKKVQEAKEIATEERWYQKQQEAIRRMDAEEDLRDEEELLKRQEVAQVRNTQIQQQKELHAKKMAELRREGEMIKQMAQADAEAEARQRLEELERAKLAHAEVVEANQYLLRAKEEEHAIERAEEARMLAYAKQKERDLLERRAREEERFQKKQAFRQQLIDAQVAKLTDLNAATNQRLERQANEVQAKAQEARNKMDEQRKNELLVMQMSRQQQMRWKRERKAQAEIDDLHYATELKKLNQRLREEEAMAIRDKFERAKARDEFLLKQVDEKRSRAEEEQIMDMYEAEQTKQWTQDDDAIFDQYAQLCLDEYVAEGKNPKPIQLVMQKIKSRQAGIDS
ncbi:hypothetical protein AB1Y20_000225 [Prymnesium parvum]|uniref:Trichohyalin-plectin-homology domain-containing protein n=1 Tax=Prymnesium parvum TaxID=97485 RepID=A0AB34K8E8_PRYPA